MYSSRYTVFPLPGKWTHEAPSVLPQTLFSQEWWGDITSVLLVWELRGLHFEYLLSFSIFSTTLKQKYEQETNLQWSPHTAEHKGSGYIITSPLHIPSHLSPHTPPQCGHLDCHSLMRTAEWRQMTHLDHQQTECFKVKERKMAQYHVWMATRLECKNHFCKLITVYELQSSYI